jgi:methylase of polypeptide subunit release factors
VRANHRFSLPVANFSLTDSPFARLLTKEVSLKPDYPVFEAGFKGILAGMKESRVVALEGLELTVPAGVYVPRAGSSTEFVARNWWAARLEEPTGTLLELGAGTGALTLLAARQGWKATGADIDGTAVDAARANAVNNRLSATFVQSDMFDAFAGQRFDVILFNQPYFHKSSVEATERALANVEGSLTQRMLDEAAGHLNPGGKLVFTYSNCSREELLERADWSFEIAACDYEARSRYWRTLIVGRPKDQR